MSFNLQISTAAAGTAAAVKVPKSTINSAIAALLKYKAAAHAATEKLQLLPQDDYIYLNLTLNNIPSKARTNPFKIPLSHPLFDPVSSQLALIIDDRPKSPTPPSDLIKKLVKSHGIPISKVIKISKLKTDYKPFEAKRKLCDSYDMFLVDKRVVHLLPKLIGKEFFKKKKLPLGVDLSKKNLKLQVERALGSALLYLRTGTCCVMKVGKVSMEKDDVVENVFDAIKGAVEKVPKKWDGVRSLHLKFHDSVALPLYQAMPDVKLKIEGVEEIEKGIEVAKISDSEGEVKKNSGGKEGKSGKKKKKGRIHEVRYMDVGDDVESDDDNVVDEFVGQKGNLMEEIDDDDMDGKDESKKIEDEGVSISGNVGKKRSKSIALKGEVLGGSNEKMVKKKAKPEKSENGKSKKDSKDESKKIEDENLSIIGNVGKKRNKSKASKEEVLGASNEENRVKKKAKSEKNDSKDESTKIGDSRDMGKKSSKSKALKEEFLGALNEEKGAKKNTKSEKNESGKSKKDGLSKKDCKDESTKIEDDNIGKKRSKSKAFKEEVLEASNEVEKKVKSGSGKSKKDGSSKKLIAKIAKNKKRASAK